MPQPVAQAARRHKGFELRLELRMLLLTLILLVVLSLSSKYFLTYNNIMNVLDQSVVVGILAVGQTAVVLTGGIDLSVGALLGWGGMVLALTGVEFGFLPSLLLGLAAGGLAGAINGLLVVKVRIAPFIVTLGMLSVARSVTYIVSGAASITDLPPMLIRLATGTILGVPIDIVFLAILYIGGWWYFAQTKGGRTIYAIGSNPEAARIAGLPIERYTIGVYVLSGMLAALAAAFMAGRIRAVDPTSGTGLELEFHRRRRDRRREPVRRPRLDDRHLLRGDHHGLHPQRPEPAGH